MENDEIQNRKPLVTVIMPAYNASQHIAQAIRSVQQQTVSDWEMIILDDCSSDATVRIVSEILQTDSRIHLYQNKENMGVAQSRNRGLDLCRSDYVAFLDSDDIWHPEKLERQMNCFRQTGADLVYTSYAIIDMEGKKCCGDFFVPATVSLDALLKKNVVGCSTVMLNRAALERYRFQTDFYHEDYVLWLRMLRDGCTMAGVEEVLVDYRYHVDSRAGNKLSSAGHRWNIYREYLGMKRWKSLWYLAHYALAGLKKYRKQ